MNARVGGDTVPDWLSEVPSSQPPSDWAPRSQPPEAAREASHVSQDLATLFRSMGMQGLRATVVELATMVAEAAWTVTERGEVLQDAAAQLPDAILTIPAAGALASQLTHTGPDETVVQKLGPRRWTFAWRLDDVRFIAAEVRYRYGRNEAREMDTALVRLMCSIGLQASAAATAPRAPGEDDGLAPGAAMAAAPSAEQQRAAAARQRWLWPAFGTALASTLLGAWLTFVALPGAGDHARTVAAEATHARQLVEASMTQRVAAALATGDYGQVQEEMSTLERLGYFRAALVTNQRARVIAIGGAAENMRVGIELPEGTVPQARAIELRSARQEPLGKLVVLTPALAEAGKATMSLERLQLLAPVATLLAGLATVFTALALRRRP